MPQAARAPVALFTLFNLVVAPVVGRIVWHGMMGLAAQGHAVVAVLVSLITVSAILGVNAGLTWWATRAGLSRRGQMALWLITGGTFALTVGFGTFSPINLVLALARRAGV